MQCSFGGCSGPSSLFSLGHAHATVLHATCRVNLSCIEFLPFALLVVGLNLSCIEFLPFGSITIQNC